MSNKSSSSSRGTGFFGLLGILFIGLKLGGVISWSWWYVLMPIYLPIAIILAIFLVFLFVASILDGMK